MREVVLSAIHPLILGDGKEARLTAWRFFAAYGVRSTITDQKRSLATLLCPFSAFRRLPPTSSDEFILMSLERFADENPDLTVILIPTSDFYRELIDRNRAQIEARFIIRSSQNACKVTPFQRQKIKD